MQKLIGIVTKQASSCLTIETSEDEQKDKW